MCSRTKTNIFDTRPEEEFFLNTDSDNFQDLNDDAIEWKQSQRLYRILGQVNLWQCLWCFILSIFQSVSTFHIFAFVFQVSFVLNFYFSVFILLPTHYVLQFNLFVNCVFSECQRFLIRIFQNSCIFTYLVITIATSLFI